MLILPAGHERSVNDDDSSVSPPRIHAMRSGHATPTAPSLHTIQEQEQDLRHSENPCNRERDQERKPKKVVTRGRGSLLEEEEEEEDDSEFIYCLMAD